MSEEEKKEKKKKKKKKSEEDKLLGDIANLGKSDEKKKKKKDKDGTEESGQDGEEKEGKKKKKKKKDKSEAEISSDPNEATDKAEEPEQEQAAADPVPPAGGSVSRLSGPEIGNVSRQSGPPPTGLTPRQDPSRAMTRASQPGEGGVSRGKSLMPPIDRRASLAPSDRRVSLVPPDKQNTQLLPPLRGDTQMTQPQASGLTADSVRPPGPEESKTNWWDVDPNVPPRRVIPTISTDIWSRMEQLTKKLLVEPRQVKFEDEELPEKFDRTDEFLSDNNAKGNDGKETKEKKKKDKKKDKKEKDKGKEKVDGESSDRDKTEKDTDRETDKEKEKKKGKKDKKNKKDKEEETEREPEDTEAMETDREKEKKKSKKDKKNKKDIEEDTEREPEDTEEDKADKKKKKKKAKSASDVEREDTRYQSDKERPKSERIQSEFETNDEEDVDALDYDPVKVVDPRMARIMARISDAKADPTESQLVDPVYPARCECCADRNDYTRGMIRDETVVARPHFIQKTVDEGFTPRRRDNGLGFYRSDSRVLIPVSNYVEKHISTEMLNSGYSHEEARRVEQLRNKAAQSVPPNLIEWPFYPNGPALAQELERYVTQDVQTNDSYVLTETINDSNVKLDEALRRLKKSINRF